MPLEGGTDTKAFSVTWRWGGLWLKKLLFIWHFDHPKVICSYTPFSKHSSSNDHTNNSAMRVPLPWFKSYPLLLNSQCGLDKLLNYSQLSSSSKWSDSSTLFIGRLRESNSLMSEKCWDPDLGLEPSSFGNFKNVASSLQCDLQFNHNSLKVDYRRNGLFHRKWTEHSYILPLGNRCSVTNKINFGNGHTHQKYPWALRRQHLCLQNGSESQHLLDVLEEDCCICLVVTVCDVHLQCCQPPGLCHISAPAQL